MDNPFDVFDAAPATLGASPAVAANPFDVFDAPAGPAQAPIPGADPGALQIRVGSRPRQDDAPASFSQLVAGDHSAPQRFASQTGTDTALGAGLRAKADEALIGPPSSVNDAIAGLFGAGQAASLNLAGNAAAGVATGLGAYNDSWPSDYLGKVPGYSPRSFAENYARFQDLLGAHARQSPKSSLAGTVAGAVASAPLLPALPVAEGANLATRALTYGGTGGAYGATAGLIGSHDPATAAADAGVGFGAGAILGPAVEKAAPYAVEGYGRIRDLLAPLAERAGYSQPARVAQPAAGFTPAMRTFLQGVGLEPSTLPDPLAQSLRTTFAAKGASPAALREAQAAEFGIPLSRGQATGDAAALGQEQRFASGAAGARAQAAANDFAGRQTEAIGSARDWLNRLIAGQNTPVANPQAAGEAVADAARRIGDDHAFRSAAAQRQADQVLEVVRGRFAPADTLDAAGLAAQGVRDAAAQAKTAYRGAYGEVAQIPGTFQPGALDRLGSRVRDRLGAEVPIDDVLTPNASRALADLDALPGLFNLQSGEGPNLQQVDQLRKRLVSYRGGTAQNPTDRRAMDQIIGHLDDHVHDAMDLGLFGPRQAPRAAAQAADGFPGAAGLDAPAAALPAAGGAPARSGEPETLTRYLARTGGVPLDAEARAGDLHRTYVPGHGTLARNGAPTWDQIRVRLAEEGFLPPGMDGAASANDVADWARSAIQAERTGARPTVRMGDEAGIGARRTAGDIADQNAAHAERLAPFRQQVVDDLAASGIRARDVNPAHLDDAAGRLYRREHDTGADAYEAAVMGRDPASGVQPAPLGSARPSEAPPLDGGASAPAGDGFPLGDTAPSDAMRRARGLFRDYRQAFAPRGPGDAAGKNLQRIVEADATPNEVAGMLFGGPSGRVTGRQLETLDRLRAAVGEDSPAWGAVRQATIGRYLEGRDVGRSLDYLLTGEGRDLANRVLTAEQRAGLDMFRTGIRQAENARTAVPGWVQDLAGKGYDGTRVLADLFGSGIPGARPGSAAYGRGLRQYLGADSPEWSGLRQAAWMRLTGDGAKLQPRVEAERIRAFTGGDGKGLATAMFSPDELAQMNRYADAVAATDVPKGGRLPDGGRAKAVAGHVLNMIAAGGAAHLGGPVLGAVAGYASRMGQQAAQGGLAAMRAERAFNGGAPRVAVPVPGYAAAAGNAGARLGGLIGSGAGR